MPTPPRDRPEPYGRDDLTIDLALVENRITALETELTRLRGLAGRLHQRLSGKIMESLENERRNRVTETLDLGQLEAKYGATP